jgi:peptidoglycan/xylan/chitin deacetylase (PgdA/CDA1 family)
MNKGRFFYLVFLLLFLVTVSQGQAPGKKICITMDDLPAVTTDSSLAHWKHITSAVLAAFRDYKVPAIGFVNEGKMTMNGEMIPGRGLLLKQWFDEGLELGNHTWSHIDYNNHTAAEFEDDLLKGAQFIDKLYASVSNRTRYFRHPFLHCGDTQEKKEALTALLEKHGYITAPVTVDNSDWIFARAYDIALDKADTAMQKRLRADYVPYMMSKVKYFESQSVDLLGRNISHILLIHANTINAICLANLLAALQGGGFAFITLAEALKDPAYKTVDGFVGRAGISWVHRWAITQQMPRAFFGNEPRTPVYVQKYAGLEE